MGTAAAVAACVLGGAHIVRVHDVAPMMQVVRMCDAIRGERSSGVVAPRRRAAAENA
jgi:dihydropteroate synthase